MPVKLHYKILGEGRPIIILHGLFGSSKNWQTIAKSLSENYQVITVDLRNHGMSAHINSMSYPEMAEDVLHLIAELALKNATLLGHSMGGKVAMINALLHPEMIDKLLVLDIAPVSYEHRYGKLFQAILNLPLDKIKSRTEAEKILDDQINDTFLTRFLLQNLIRTDNGFQWRLNLPALQSNIEHISRFPDMMTETKYDKPALFLGGADSDFIRPEHHTAIHRYFPAARIELLENASHMLHIDQPDRVLERIRQFLQT